jgi:hypothetical protein
MLIFFTSPLCPYWHLNPPSLLTNWCQRQFSPVVKRQGLEIHHSSTSSAEVKNAWNYTSTPTYIFMASWLIKCRGDKLGKENLQHFRHQVKGELMVSGKNLGLSTGMLIVQSPVRTMDGFFCPWNLHHLGNVENTRLPSCGSYLTLSCRSSVLTFILTLTLYVIKWTLWLPPSQK